MKFHLISLIAVSSVSVSVQLDAQPYHADTTVNGVQTLKVEGDLSVEQYGAGSGGDLKVVGDGHVGIGGIPLANMPSGVSGTYYGTQKIGEALNVGEYLFEATGDNDTGDFIVPLGVIGDWEGSLIKLDVLTGPHDYDSGGAHFTILSKRIASQGGIIATDHTAVGGGRNVSIFGKNNGMIHLYLKFDAAHPWGGVRIHKLRVKVSTIGSINATTVWEPFSAMTPIILGESLVTDQVSGDSMTHSLNAQNIQLNGAVSIASAPGIPSNIILNGSTGRITLSGSGSGIYAGSNPVFTLDGSGNVSFASGSTLSIANNSTASSSSSGALTISGGVGIGMDSYINGVRVGKGNSSIASNTVLGSDALSGNFIFGSANTAVGASVLKVNFAGWSNTAVGSGSMSSNTNGSYNAALGVDSLKSNTTGTRNTALGSSAMSANTTGNYNVGIGMGNMQGNTTGGGNSSVGNMSLGANTTGNGNTAAGNYSMLQNTTGGGNAAFGSHSAIYLNGGDYNVMIGASAGSQQADGVSPLVTPGYSVYVGAASRGKDNSDYNSIVIGANAIGEGANTTVIGNEATIGAKIHGELVVPDGFRAEGHTILDGAVTISNPQGDISMGIYE